MEDKDYMLAASSGGTVLPDVLQMLFLKIFLKIKMVAFWRNKSFT